MPRKSFSDFVEGWIFCDYPILLWKWERARAVAEAPEHKTVLSRMANNMRQGMRRHITRQRGEKGKFISDEELENIVLQTVSDDRYASPLIAERFQILEGWIGQKYYVVDHFRTDLIWRVAGPASKELRFDTIKDAEDAIKRFTEGSVTPISPLPEQSGSEQKQEIKMAKAAAKKTEDAAPKVGGRPPVKKTNGVPGAAAAALNAARGAVSKKAKEAAPAPEEKKIGRSKTEGAATMSSLARQLLKEGRLSDDKIKEKVAAAFPDKVPPANLVSYHRKALIQAGELAG